MKGSGRSRKGRQKLKERQWKRSRKGSGKAKQRPAKGKAAAGEEKRLSHEKRAKPER